MNVPDWDYLAFVISESESEDGYLETLSLIYRDGTYKAKSRVKFPIGACIVGELSNRSLKGLMEKLEAAIVGMPGTSDHIIIEVWNKHKSTKGNDLMKALIETPNLRVKLVDTDTEDIP